MVESVMICVDNSSWMLNGDYAPSRLECVMDSSLWLLRKQLNSNPENVVGVLQMNPVEVLVTLSTDVSKLMNAMHGLRLVGRECRLSDSLQVCQLALKHRQNRNGQARIVVYLGSPISDTRDELNALALMLKKNNVHLDIVCFGEADYNLLGDFITAVAGASQLIRIAPCDVREFANTARAGLLGADAQAGNAAGGDDMEMDPELLMAIQASLEEERRRNEAANPSPNPNPTQPAAATPAAAAPQVSKAEAEQDEAELAGKVEMDTMDVDDDELNAAIALSMAQMSNSSLEDAVKGLPGVDLNDPKVRAALGGGAEKKKEENKEKSEEQEEEEMPDMDAMTEEEQLEYAIRMSTKEDAKRKK